MAYPSAYSSLHCLSEIICTIPLRLLAVKRAKEISQFPLSVLSTGKEQQFSGHLLHRFRRHFRQKDPCNHKEGSDESRHPRILGKEYHAPERRKKRIERTEEPCVLSRHVLLRDRLERKAEARAEEDERQKVQDRAPLLRHRNRTDRNGRDGAEKAHETHLPYADGKRVERFHILCCQENEECIAERRQKTVNDARRNVRPTAFQCQETGADGNDEDTRYDFSGRQLPQSRHGEERHDRKRHIFQEGCQVDVRFLKAQHLRRHAKCQRDAKDGPFPDHVPGKRAHDAFPVNKKKESKGQKETEP